MLEIIMPSKNFIIHVTKNTSQKASDKVQEIAYLAHLKKFGQPLSYRLEQRNNENFLIPNHIINSDLSDLKRPDNETYIFVIIKGVNGAPELKIGHGSHYHLANKANTVLAAGEISFSNNQIMKINNQSGSYHVDIMNTQPDKQEEYLSYIKETLGKVNLPIDKFQDFQKSKIISHYNIFVNKKIIIGFATASLAAAMMTYSLT